MKRLFRLLFPLSVALFLACCTVRAQEIQTKIDQYMKASMKAEHFMGAILVAQHRRVLFSKGYGWANVKLRIPNTPETEFFVGSITKEFTAMAVLELQERGKLSVQDPVCKYVPDCPKNWQSITIFNLLTHTSGIPDFTTFSNYSKVETQAATPSKLLALFENKPLDFRPGAKFSYSNSGYVLLGYIIHRASGEAYQEFLTKNIFEPLGMQDSGYDRISSANSTHAQGYVYSKGGYVSAPYVNMAILFSAGALYSTTLDLYKWDRAIEAGKLISGNSRDEMLTPQVAMGNSGRFHYGFGWMITREFGHREIFHGGGVEGFTSLNSWFPDDDAYIIVLDNMTMPPPEVSDIRHALAAILFGQKYEAPKEH